MEQELLVFVWLRDAAGADFGAFARGKYDVDRAEFGELRQP